MIEDLVILRKELKLTQRQLADKAGVSKSTIAHIEKRISMPNGDTICRVARAVGQEPDCFFKWLFHDEECWGGGELE